MDLGVLSSLVPEVALPMEFARAIGQRPKKGSFAVATVGDMPGLFCSAWAMIVTYEFFHEDGKTTVHPALGRRLDRQLARKVVS